MIFKKVKRNKGKSKEANIRDLVNYITNGENEKVFYANGIGFSSNNPNVQREEMVSLAAEAPRSWSPVYHYILSFQEGEKPTKQQVDEAVIILMKHMGLKDHQAIYALHQDTDNYHIHIAVNRIHPETCKSVEINKGFDVKAGHQAIALIEHKQGWKSEKNARYTVLDNGKLVERAQAQNRQRQPSQKQRDMENRTGEKSAQRIAIENAATIINQAQSWEELHREMALKGMRYEKTGSGATIFVGDIGVKASSVDRKASFSKLQKRLGEFQSAPRQVKVIERSPEPITQNIPGWDTYIRERRIHYTEKRTAKRQMDEQQEEEKRSLHERHKAERDAAFEGEFKGVIDGLNALRSVVAKRQADERKKLRKKHQEERKAWREKYQSYPSLEQWLQEEYGTQAAQDWRFRNRVPEVNERNKVRKIKRRKKYIKGNPSAVFRPVEPVKAPVKAPEPPRKPGRGR